MRRSDKESKKSRSPAHPVRTMGAATRAQAAQSARETRRGGCICGGATDGVANGRWPRLHASATSRTSGPQESGEEPKSQWVRPCFEEGGVGHPFSDRGRAAHMWNLKHLRRPRRDMHRIRRIRSEPLRCAQRGTPRQIPLPAANLGRMSRAHLGALRDLDGANGDVSKFGPDQSRDGRISAHRPAN